MAIDATALLAHDFGERRQAYDARDAILYALGVGLPVDPLDRDELRFLDETRLDVLPTFAVTLGSPGMWIRDPRFGVDFARLVHVAQQATFHATLPAAGSIVATARVASLTDRGEGRGAELVVERFIRAEADGTLLCTARQTLLLRGDGGFGGELAVRAPAFRTDRPADLAVDMLISPRAALIYRLSGDWNPLHIDPDFARRAGFERPIMHGLGLYGAAGAALSRALGRDPVAIASLSCRFAGVAYPGDTLALSIWADGGGARFAAMKGNHVVLADGSIDFHEGAGA